MSNDFLSQEEVDALLSNVNGEAPQAATTGSDAHQQYDLTKQERIVRGRMATLEIINDRAIRTLRQNLYSLLRRSPEITHAGVRPLKYSEWMKHLPVPASFNIIQIKGLRGNALFVLEPGLIFALIDTLFGGNGQFHTRIEGRDFSQTEQQVISRITSMLCETFTSAWRPIIPLEFQLLRTEIQSQFAQIATPSEVVLACQFRVELGDSSGHFWTCLPYASIEPIKSQLTNDLQNDTDRDDSRWRQVLTEHVIGSKSEVVCEVARLQMPLSAILKLQPGTTIELDESLVVKGYCSGQIIFTGKPGVHNSKYAVEISTVRQLGENK